MKNETKRQAPERQPPPNKAPSGDDIDFAAGGFLTFAAEEEDDKKKMRVSLMVAGILHAVLLAATFPELIAEPMQPQKQQKLYMVQQVRFQPPPPQQKQELPKLRARRVPIPDPTPDQPEPLLIDEPVTEIEVPNIEEMVFGIPDAPPEVPTGPIFVGGDVVKPEKIHAPQPQYTEVARRARVQGVVIVQAIIDKEGNVTNTKVIKGLPMGLDDEAVKAIKTWKFTPATLNDAPVDVYYTLTVNFQLQ